MSALSDRLVGGHDTTPGPFARSLSRVIASTRSHRSTLAWLIPVLAIAGAISAVNLAGAPQRIDDEGTYTAQAWAVLNLHELAHYTYWYDHPPLGWLQLAVYAQLTGAFARYTVAVIAMREAMVVLSLVSLVLLWALTRRIGFSRPAAAAAGLVFALSPLALQYHRTVYLDNVATPWLLAALLLVHARRAQLAAFTGAALCFGIAVLSKETYLLALPLLAFVAIRGAEKETRRYTLAVAGSVLAVVGGGYLLLAAIKGELLPHAGQVSLMTGVLFQLGTRASSGSVLTHGSDAFDTASVWWQLDPVLIVAALVAAVVALALRGLRAWGVFLLAAVAFLLRPGGYIPVPFVIMLIPIAAILVVGVGDRAIAALRARRHRLAAVAGVAVLAAATAAWIPLTAVQLRGFVLSNLDQPMVQTEQWIGANVPKSDRLIVDDAMWVDLVDQGRARSNVVWYYKVDTDPAVEKQSPHGWRDADYVVTTNSMRTFPDAFPRVQKAIDNSIVVASFGTGTRRVDVRQVLPDGLKAGRSALGAVSTQAAIDGTALAANPELTASASDLALLRAGRVDDRIVLALGARLAVGAVTVTGFPVTDGDRSAVRREVSISRLGDDAATDQGRLSSASRDFVAMLGAAYAPAGVDRSGDDLVLHYDLADVPRVG